MAFARGQDLLHGGIARCGQHHISRCIERLAAVIEHLRGDLSNALAGARDVAADGVAVVQALTQAGDQPPVGAVVVHLDLLPDDALLLGDGLLGEVGVPHHPQQHIEAFVQLLRGGEEVTGAVKAGKGVGVGPRLRELCKGVAVLILEHLVFQKMRHTCGQMHLPPIEPEVPVNGAEAGGIDDMGAGIPRHGPHKDGQAGGQDLPLIRGGIGKRLAAQFRHRRSPPLLSTDN